MKYLVLSFFLISCGFENSSRSRKFKDSDAESVRVQALFENAVTFEEKLKIKYETFKLNCELKRDLSYFDESRPLVKEISWDLLNDYDDAKEFAISDSIEDTNFRYSHITTIRLIDAYFSNVGNKDFKDDHSAELTFEYEGNYSIAQNYESGPFVITATPSGVKKNVNSFNATTLLNTSGKGETSEDVAFSFLDTCIIEAVIKPALRFHEEVVID